MAVKYLIFSFYITRPESLLGKCSAPVDTLVHDDDNLSQAVSGIVDLNSERAERSSEDAESQDPGMSGSDENSRENFLSLNEVVNGDKQGKTSRSRHLNKKGSKKAKLK